MLTWRMWPRLQANEVSAHFVNDVGHVGVEESIQLKAAVRARVKDLGKEVCSLIWSGAALAHSIQQRVTPALIHCICL